jgi:SNF2 family DNA or RNA helicase
MGGVFPQIVTWLDDENKCAECGQHREHPDHAMINIASDDYHPFKPTVNEVSYLYERLKGLVIIQLKKDCIDLPDKVYEEIIIKPNVETLQAAKLIKAKSTSAIKALTLLRELSDGFQYQMKDSGRKETCDSCKGTGEYMTPRLKEDADPEKITEDSYTFEMDTCDACAGEGKLTIYDRDTVNVLSPKDEYFIDDLDAYSDIGRYIVWGGFTATIDRLVDMANSAGWSTLRIDGGGFKGQTPTKESIDPEILLSAMDRSHPKYKELLETYPRVCVVGHPQAGGIGLTLTASPVEMFYSNCFSGDARMQAEDRFHRIGMDENHSPVIKDLIHLPSDKLVLDNLKKKKKLQSLSMGELSAALA